MHDAPPPYIFLSYARSDRDYAVVLRDDLNSAGLTVWHDLKDLEAGQWWSQIADALEDKSVEHIVLIASPDARTSRVVAQECWFAQREGKTASLVVPPQHAGKIDFKNLPRFMQAAHHYNLTEPDQKAKFVERLRKPGRGPRRPRPEGRPTPANYVARDREYGKMRAALLDANGDATSATVVLCGPGGFGKTTLATAFVNDEVVQQAYFNGILLVELGEGLAKLPKTEEGGETLEDLIKTKIEVVIKTLAGIDERFDELDTAKTRLKEILDKRHGAILLWIDDAWDADHARHFIDASPNVSKLVTTRIRDMLPEATARVDVDELTDAEAAAFMRSGLKPANDFERKSLSELATISAGRWPILIRQINAQLRYQTTAQSGRKAQALGDCVAALRTRLKREGLDDLDKSTDSNRATAVRLSVGVSFDMLREEDRHRKYAEGFHEARYRDFAGFQEAEVPIATIARLWEHLGVLRRIDAPTLDAEDEKKRKEQVGVWHTQLREESLAILERLYALALFQKLGAADADGTVRLHDVMRQYLADRQMDAMQAFHEQFVLAYDGETGETSSDMTERERCYFYTWFPSHLHEASKNELDEQGRRPMREALNALLLDPKWMQRKLDALKGPLPLISDYQRLEFSENSLQGVVGRTLRLTSGILGRDPRQLLPQLLGRLIECADKGAPTFLDQARRLLTPPAILAQCPSLTPPGAETARLEGHKGPVSALAVLPDGRLASGSWDRTIRLWDLKSGAETARLEGHTRSVTALALLPDGQLASGSEDNTIRLWDARSGTVTAWLEGHTRSVTALTVLADGQLASGSENETIRLWDPNSGAETARLEGHKGPVSALALLPDGRLASAGSWDRTIRLWDLASGKVIAQLEGHTERVRALAVLRDGRLASGSEDETIRLWDLGADRETARLEARQRHERGRKRMVTSLAELKSGQLATGLSDATIRLWDLASGKVIAQLEGHTGPISALAVVKDDQLASGTGDRFASFPGDNTIRLWHPGFSRGTARFEGHTGPVRALLVLPDGRLASASADRTIRLWDPANGKEIGRFEGHTSGVRALAVLEDGRLASGSEDATIRLWDLVTGKSTVRIKGQTEWFLALVTLPDGQLASGNDYRTIGLWNIDSGRSTARLEEHLSAVRALAVLTNGRLVSGSQDGTIRLWDFQIGKEIARFEGHTGWVMALAVLADGRLVSGSQDGTIRLWDPANGKEIGRFEGHTSGVRALAVLADGRLASGSEDRTIRLWSLAISKEVARLDIDSPVLCLAPLAGGHLVAGDQTGRVHWLELLV